MAAPPPASAAPFGFRPPQRRITVRCKVVGGAQFEFDLDPASTVRAMKVTLGAKLEEQGCGVAMEHFRLLAKGRFLVDDATVRECKVSKGSKLLLLGSDERTVEPPAKEIVESTEAVGEAAAALHVVREWDADATDEGDPALDRAEQVDKTRCWTCNKGLGLTGVECRCGYTFCSHHRYAECHECDFDHKTYFRGILEKQLLGGVAVRDCEKEKAAVDLDAPLAEAVDIFPSPSASTKILDVQVFAARVLSIHRCERAALQALKAAQTPRLQLL
eukprot:CAMPEP_0117536422 /NCGR_PEP_ID=MMETSP0784-20121206/41445_1 /TAXON_ID=39447 /ORGANISM="" /LENGTH=273 /DNA_ID=CAMNT_0005332985 /DNA_START=53 /DNA_END=873 /DNA_ORIENTATION=+